MGCCMQSLKGGGRGTLREVACAAADAKGRHTNKDRMLYDLIYIQPCKCMLSWHYMIRFCQHHAWGRCTALDREKSVQRVHANLASVLLTIFIAMNII